MNKKRDFLRVIDNKRCFYGGYQKWLIDESISTFFANRSCAVTAITNVILNKRNIVSKKYYSKKQVEVFKKIKPFIWGVPTVNILVKKTKKLNLKAFVFKEKWTKSNLLKYISFAITKENLVLMINWNSSISNLKYHWITITEVV